MPDHGENDGFLMRWSRRKRGNDEAVKAKPHVAEAEPVPITEDVVVASHDQPTSLEDAVQHEDAAANQDRSEGPEAEAESETVPAELENVDIEALTYDSDYTQFMQEGVPEALKRRALRQLWRSDPILANVDGLNDYDGDFTDAALAVDVLKTIHKVGRGYLTDEDDDTDDLDETDELEVADGQGASQDDEVDKPGDADNYEVNEETDNSEALADSQTAEDEIALSQVTGDDDTKTDA